MRTPERGIDPRLRKIERSEPDPALFRAPSDYQIVDDQHDHAEIKIP